MYKVDATVREGIIAGLLGATSIAIWFLIVDTVGGRPFYTPSVLGIGLLSVFGPRGDEGMVAQVIAYTIFHYGIFLGIGMLVSYVVHRAEKDDTVLAVALILFVALEVGFYGLVAVLSQSRQLGNLAW